MSPIEDLDRYVDLSMACAVLGLKPATIRSQINKGKPTALPIYKHPVTGRLVVLEGDVRAYHARLRTTSRVDRAKEESND